MGDHLVDGEFQSDKYPWCKRGFVPLKLTDPMAHPVLWNYAEVRASVDQEFADDLKEALRSEGYAANPSVRDESWYQSLFEEVLPPLLALRDISRDDSAEG